MTRLLLVLTFALVAGCATAESQNTEAEDYMEFSDEDQFFDDSSQEDMNFDDEEFFENVEASKGSVFDVSDVPVDVPDAPDVPAPIVEKTIGGNLASSWMAELTKACHIRQEPSMGSGSVMIRRLIGAKIWVTDIGDSYYKVNLKNGDIAFMWSGCFQ